MRSTRIILVHKSLPLTETCQHLRCWNLNRAVNDQNTSKYIKMQTMYLVWPTMPHVAKCSSFKWHNFYSFHFDMVTNTFVFEYTINLKQNVKRGLNHSNNSPFWLCLEHKIWPHFCVLQPWSHQQLSEAVQVKFGLNKLNLNVHKIIFFNTSIVFSYDWGGHPIP